jgi:hypothetical protein
MKRRAKVIARHGRLCCRFFVSTRSGETTESPGTEVTTDGRFGLIIDRWSPISRSIPDDVPPGASIQDLPAHLQRGLSYRENQTNEQLDDLCRQLHGKGTAYKAPLPVRTTRIVRNRILMSFHRQQFCRYNRSSATLRRKLSMLLS